MNIHLAVKAKEHDRLRHLVVELEAPDITAGRTERNQIEGYINVVVDNAAFASERSEWEFILAVTDYDFVMDNSIIGSNRELGLVFEPDKKPGVRQSERTCAVAGHHRREQASPGVRDQLAGVRSSLAEGLAFIRDEYAEMLPDELGGTGLLAP